MLFCRSTYQNQERPSARGKIAKSTPFTKSPSTRPEKPPSLLRVRNTFLFFKKWQGSILLDSLCEIGTSLLEIGAYGEKCLYAVEVMMF